MGWRGYIDHPRETVFFWSQKAACTTLFAVLADNITPRPTDKRHFHRASFAFPACLRAVHESGFRAVILVRHPVSRAISAYFNKFCLYRGHALKTRADLEPFAQDLHDHFCALRGQATDDNVMSFEDYLDTVADLFAHRATPKTPLNGHWDTQYPAFLEDETPGLRYDTVLQVETFDADMTALAQKLDMRFKPRVMNKTDLAAKRHRGYLGRVEARRVAEYPFSPANFMSPATIDRIEALYGHDFQRFGYRLLPKDSPRGLLTRMRLRRRIGKVFPPAAQ